MVSFISVSSDNQLQIIEDLAYTIWNEHYTPIIGKAQVDYMLQKFQSVKTMSEQIKNNYQYYIINFDNRAIGYLAFKIENTDLFLSKIYILKNQRGKSFGKQAMQFVYNQAQIHKCNSISLTVNKNNTNSIKAYEKIGFNKVQALIMDIGNGFVMDDFKMTKSVD